MAASTTIVYDLPSDKVTGTWSKTGGTVNSTYPLTNLDDTKPWNPTIFTANPTRLSIDHSSSVRLDVVSFIHCNFPAGYVPVVSRGSSLGTPLTTSNVTCAGPAEDSMPANPWVDMTLLSGYGNYRYTWIDLPATGTLLSLGEIRLSSHKRVISDAITTVRDRNYGANDRESHPTIERYTDAGTQVGYSRGTRARWLSGTVSCDEDGFSELETWTRASLGRFRPFLLIPDPSVNEAWFAKWGASADLLFQRTYPDLGIFDVQVDFEEVGRGLAP